jgi:predicted ATPase
MPQVPAGRPGRSPADGTPFVGRTAELDQLTSLLSQARLITVTGPGGVGKTRLALRAAGRARPSSLHSACAVGLSAVTDARLVPHAVAARLSLDARDTVPAHNTVPARDAVLRFLRDRKMLLVLDACEHLLDACAELAGSLLRKTDGVVILATSRQPLDVSGENVFPLAPLPVPADGGPPAPGDAVSLFARAAAQAMPGFKLTSAVAADVIRVCRRADGLPLALELAAARLPAMSLSELAGQPALLAGGALDRTMGRSYDRCTAAEQVLWQRLSVFAGAISLKAAEEVCAGPDLARGAILETLVGLVDKSVLARETGGQADDGPARFRQLGTIREFGARKLAEAEAGDASTGDAVRQRYLAWVVAELAAATPGPGPGPGRSRGLTRREEEVAGLAVSGLSNREIADRMTIAKRTVDAHIEHIYAKLDVSSRVGLARRLRQDP